MTKYKITDGFASWTVEVENDHVLSVNGKKIQILAPWHEVRESYERDFLTIIPVIERPVSLRFAGVSYELHWVGEDLVRITDEDGKDLTWDQLPRQLKDALS